MSATISEKEMNLLRGTNTPTIANAIERMNFRGRMEGFTRGNVRAMFPELGVMLGYAVTVKIRSCSQPAKPASLKDYWKYITTMPTPRVVVVQDLDEPCGGAWWGEVNGNIHRTLGCAGVVTNGSVRDLDEVRPLGFHFFAASVAVSHGYAFPESFGEDVVVDGMSVRPGELVHADKHGAITFPAAKVQELLKAIQGVEVYERPMLQLCKSTTFTIEKLDGLMRSDAV